MGISVYTQLKIELSKAIYIYLTGSNVSSLINNTNADALSQCIRKRLYPFSKFWKAECGLSNLYIYVVRNTILKYFSAWADVTICDVSYMNEYSIKGVGKHDAQSKLI